MSNTVLFAFLLTGTPLLLAEKGQDV